MNAELYRVPDAADQMSISTKTLRNWIAQSKIAVVRIGGHAVRVPRTEIDRLIDEGYSPARRTA